MRKARMPAADPRVGGRGSPSMSLLAAYLGLVVAFLKPIGGRALAEEPAKLLQPTDGKHWLSPTWFGPDVKKDAPEPITVHVEKPPYVEVFFVIRYLSQHGGCSGFNPFLYFETGAGRMPLEFVEVYRLPAGLTSQTVKLPVDKYDSGRCLWKPVELATGEFDSRYQTYKLDWSWPAYSLYRDGPKAAVVGRTCRDFAVPPGKKNIMLTCDFDKATGHSLNLSGSFLTIHYSMSGDH
jgi:hypothetical protein